MTFKTCVQCKIKKTKKEFSFRNKNRGYLQSSCKECKKQESIQWFSRNSNYSKVKSKKWRELNPEKRLNYINNTKNERKISRKSFNDANKQKRNTYEVERRKKDPQYKLACNLRRRFLCAIKKDFKKGSAIKDLGCSIQEFKKYIESKFQPGMNWDNWGNGVNKWNLDHIFPLSKSDLTKKEDLIKVLHYTNLQPLWFLDNVIKGNKVICE